MVAMLLRNEFDSAASRKELFTGNVYFDTKIILTKRPRWIEGSTGSPRHNYAWFVWDFEREIGLRTPPTIRVCAMNMVTPVGLPLKRGLNREEASNYIGVSASKFDQLVASKQMPYLG